MWYYGIADHMEHNGQNYIFIYILFNIGHNLCNTLFQNTNIMTCRHENIVHTLLIIYNINLTIEHYNIK